MKELMKHILVKGTLTDFNSVVLQFMMNQELKIQLEQSLSMNNRYLESHVTTMPINHNSS